MNLIEIMIVVGILVALVAVTIPLAGYTLRLEQREAVANLAMVYERLHKEAMLRNLTFRVAYHLDENYYQVEVSEDPALLFKEPRARLEYEAALQEKMERQASRFADPSEVTIDESGMAVDQASFSAVQDKFLKKFELPSNTRFGGVYTPAYGELVEPSGDDPEEVDEEDRVVVYSYILPSGLTEHTVVHLVRAGDPNSGFTLEVEPMTGQVHIDNELLDWDERFAFVPDTPPDLD
jgi:type II secretory pathway pseudopilin PulG